MIHRLHTQFREVFKADIRGGRPGADSVALKKVRWHCGIAEPRYVLLVDGQRTAPPLGVRRVTQCELIA